MTSLGIGDYALDELELRGRVVEYARSLVGAGYHNGPEQRARYVAAILPFDPPAQALQEAAKMSSCGLTCEAILRAADVDDDRLYQPYGPRSVGHGLPAVALQVDIARKAGAWTSTEHHDGSLPNIGDMVLQGRGGGGAAWFRTPYPFEHVYTVVQLDDDGGVWTVDGGEPDIEEKRKRFVSVDGELWACAFDAELAPDGRPARGVRVAGFLDLFMMPHKPPSLALEPPMYSHFRHRSAPGLEQLWVVAVLSNPQRYRSRYRLFEAFQASMAAAGANLFVVELAHGDRPHEMTEAGNPRHLQLRSRDELWHKERMINLGVQRLPSDWRFMAWVDGDIEFVRPDWREEICHQLQQHQVVQLFQNAVDLGPAGEVMQTYDGWGHSHVTCKPPPYSQPGGYPHWHPGYGWAWRREAFDAVGGMIDTGILGASDHHMAWAMLGQVEQQTPTEVSAGYLAPLLAWQERARIHIRENVGYMPGTILHHWHGKKKDRQYLDRWKMIIDGGFDPAKDIRVDSQGLYAFTDAGLRHRNAFRRYFAARNEDSVEL